MRGGRPPAARESDTPAIASTPGSAPRAIRSLTCTSSGETASGSWIVSMIEADHHGVGQRATDTTDDAQASQPAGYQQDYVELHARSAFSFLRAGSGVEALVARAAQLGMSALALTDHMTLAGVVRFQAACASARIRPILPAELAVPNTLSPPPP